MFADKGNNNLFSKSTLFGGNTGSSLFGSTSLFGNQSATGSLFGNTKPVFNFTNLNTGKTFITDNDKKKEDESEDDGEGGDDLFEGSNSPKAYNPVEVVKTEESLYSKKYVKQIENLFAYNKEQNKFISKGNGYLSIEYSDKDGKKAAVIAFR